jgi:hypothetical protein
MRVHTTRCARSMFYTPSPSFSEWHLSRAVAPLARPASLLWGLQTTLFSFNCQLRLAFCWIVFSLTHNLSGYVRQTQTQMCGCYRHISPDITFHFFTF